MWQSRSARQDRGALGAVLAALALLACASAHAQPAMTCDVASVRKLGLPKTRIVSAAAVKDDPRAGPHCAVRAAVNERLGSDAKPYAIGFEMRLARRVKSRCLHQAEA